MSMTEEMRVSILLARTATLNAEVAGMQAANALRAIQGASPAYDDKAFYDAIERNRLGENGIALVAIHGEF